MARFVTDGEGLTLIAATEPFEQGSVAVKVALPTGDVHTIAVAPFAVRYEVSDGVVEIYSSASEFPIRVYGSWLWVEESAVTRSSGRMATVL